MAAIGLTMHDPQCPAYSSALVRNIGGPRVSEGCRFAGQELLDWEYKRLKIRLLCQDNRGRWHLHHLRPSRGDLHASYRRQPGRYDHGILQRRALCASSRLPARFRRHLHHVRRSGRGHGPFQGTYPSGLNSPGAITGFYQDASNGLHGFVRARDGPFTSFDPPGSVKTFPSGINPAGAITGYYYDASFLQHGFLRIP